MSSHDQQDVSTGQRGDGRDPIPCGGCGAASGAERCLGCLHDFGDEASAWVRSLAGALAAAAVEGAALANHPLKVGEREGLTLTALHEANIARQAEWCPDQVPDLSFRGNELAGETGEACNVIKKLERERQGWRGSRATLADLAEELADVVICADLCAVTAGIDLSAAVVAKFNATSDKVGISVRLAAAPTPTEAAPSEGACSLDEEARGYFESLTQMVARVREAQKAPRPEGAIGIADVDADEIEAAAYFIERLSLAARPAGEDALREAIERSEVDFFAVLRAAKHSHTSAELTAEGLANFYGKIWTLHHQIKSLEKSREGKPENYHHLRSMDDRAIEGLITKAGKEAISFMLSIASPTQQAPDQGGAAPQDERLWWFLKVLDGAGGNADASDGKWNWINAFCDDRGQGADTYNLARELKYTGSTHDSDSDYSEVHITELGRQYIAAATPKANTGES